MKASVIIPTYQRQAFLSDALKTVLEQDFSKDQYEIIIVDNASRITPELAILHEETGGPPIHYIHEPRNGLHLARLAGARSARGELLLYVDDDVLCPPSWLAAMVDSFMDENVGLVAGRVFLQYEAPQPAWLNQFEDVLSALDLGDTPQTLTAYQSPVGCNMSIRKSVLFAVGGFNPDAFGDRRLLYLRGDGEVGLARKVHEAGWVVWYSPDAWLNHRVPASRMTLDYIKWRSAISGIEDAYTDLRYNHRSVPELLIRSCASLVKYLYHKLQAITNLLDPWRHAHHLAFASRYLHRALHHWRQASSKELRNYTNSKDYV